MAEDRKLSTKGMNWMSPTEVRNAHADANPGSVPLITAEEVVVTTVVAAATGAGAAAASDDDDSDNCYDSYSGAVFVPKTFGGLVIYLLVLALFGLVLCR